MSPDEVVEECDILLGLVKGRSQKDVQKKRGRGEARLIGQVELLDKRDVLG